MTERSEPGPAVGDQDGPCELGFRCTRDTLWRGTLTLWQPARGHGYRFNLDPVLLSSFVEPADHVIDLGSGCGVLGLLLLKSGRARRVTAVEYQPLMAKLTARNRDANGFDAQSLRVVHADLREVRLPPADAVVCNPPYFPPHAGRASPFAGRDSGRHERKGTLNDFLRVGLHCLKTPGAFYAILPETRRPELEVFSRDLGWGGGVRRAVCTRPGKPPHRALIRVEREGPLRWESPLVVHGPKGRSFTPEVQGMVDGEALT